MYICRKSKGERVGAGEAEVEGQRIRGEGFSISSLLN